MQLSRCNCQGKPRIDSEAVHIHVVNLRSYLRVELAIYVQTRGTEAACNVDRVG